MADSDNESGGVGHGNAQSEREREREQDRFLPIANVSRIMKKALPANAKISKEAKETVQECVSEFISFVTGEASDKCQREKRKTINGDDLLWAMTTLGFEDYVEPLKVYLQKFRDMEGERNAVAGGGGGGSVGGRQGGERDGSPAITNGSVVNSANNGVVYPEGGAGMYGAMPSNMVMMGQQHPQGHVYGPGAYYQMAGIGTGKVGSGYPGSGSSTGRPR